MKNSEKKWLTRIKDALIKNLGSPDIHYSSHLPVKSGFISSAIRNFLFRNISLNPKQLEKIKGLPENSIIIYASKYRSHFEYLFYFTRFQKMGLPYPTIGFDHRFIIWQPAAHLIKILYSHLHHLIRHFRFPDPFENGHMRTQLLGGRSALMTLIGKESFYERFVKDKADPIRLLIELQTETDRPVFIIPELIFFSPKPIKVKLSVSDLIFGTQERPGKLRRLFTLLGGSKNSFAEIIDPMDLKACLQRPDISNLGVVEQAALIRRELVTRINRHRQTITGPVLKSREELKESILTSPAVQSFLTRHAEKENLPIRDVNKKADAYLEEIAANYSHKWITAFKITLDWLFRNLFEGITVDHEGLSRVKEMSIKAPLVLVPCHKSHLDYLILSYLFHINNMPCPHIAAGKNLSFWPMGTIFRGGGAFFMRRTFKGAELYSKIFSEYMKKLLSEGFNIELFIEGTRSRTGKLLPPKFGLLSILIDAFRDKACEDLLFVPVFFGYDRVLEEDAYLHEVEGGEKEPESVGQIIKARRFLKKRYGKVYVNFHEPISLKSYIEENGLAFYEQSREEHAELCKSIGYRLTQSIKRVSLATPYGIVAGAILNSPKKRFSHEQLMSDVAMYINYMKSQDIMLSETLLQGNDRAIVSVIENYIRRKFIDINTEGDEEPTAKTIYKINFSKRPLLGYYKNTCINFFISATYTSLSILKRKSFQFKSSDLIDTYTTLMHLFDNDFTYDRDTQPEYYIRKDIKAFINDGILTPHTTLPETYDITTEGYRRLNCFACFLNTYLESYLVVLHFFKRHPEREPDTKADVKKIQSIGRRMFKNHEIELPESLSEITYKNALSFFNQKGLGEVGADDKIRHYHETLEEFITLIHD